MQMINNAIIFYQFLSFLKYILWVFKKIYSKIMKKIKTKKKGYADDKKRYTIFTKTLVFSVLI